MLQRRFTLIIVILVSLVLASCQSYQPKDKTTDGFVTVYDAKAFFGDELTAEMIQAAKDWDAKWGCKRNIIIMPFETAADTKLDGSTETTLEEAEPGIIHMGKEGNARFIVLHSMTHACTNGGKSITPIKFSDGEIIGFNGMSIKIRRSVGEIVYFRKIEEGIAERNALLVDKDYTVTHQGYFQIGYMTRDHIPDTVNLQDQLRANNVPYVASILLGRDVNFLKAEDYENLMAAYTDQFEHR